MIVGEHQRPETYLAVNVCKRKHLTNMRTSMPTREVDEPLPAARHPGLDEAIEYLADDELLEVTPTSLRLHQPFVPRHPGTSGKEMTEARRGKPRQRINFRGA